MRQLKPIEVSLLMKQGIQIGLLRVLWCVVCTTYNYCYLARFRCRKPLELHRIGAFPDLKRSDIISSDVPIWQKRSKKFLNWEQTHIPFTSHCAEGWTHKPRRSSGNNKKAKHSLWNHCDFSANFIATTWLLLSSWVASLP